MGTIMRGLRLSGILFSVFLATACVSTIDTSGPKIDKRKALEANVKLGMSYLQNGDRDRALRAFTKAQELDIKSGEAMQGLALVHQLNGETELAEEKFLKALKLRADFSRSSIELSYARFLYEYKRYAEAINYLEKASNDISYPNRGMALYVLGLSALETGDIVRAKGSFEHALNLNSRNAAAALELADIYFSEKDYASAKRYLDQYAKNSRQNARSLLLGIKIERVFGNKDKEASYALALKNLHPYSKEYLEYKQLKK